MPRKSWKYTPGTCAEKQDRETALAKTRPAPALFPAVLGRRLVWLRLPSGLFGCFAGQGVGGSGGFETNGRANRPLSGTYEQCGLKVQGHGGLHVEPRRRPAEGPKRWQRNPRRRKGSRSAPGRSAGSELWVQRGDHERSERARETQRRSPPTDVAGTGTGLFVCHTARLTTGERGLPGGLVTRYRSEETTEQPSE